MLTVSSLLYFTIAAAMTYYCRKGYLLFFVLVVTKDVQQHAVTESDLTKTERCWRFCSYLARCILKQLSRSLDVVRVQTADTVNWRHGSHILILRIYLTSH